MTKTIPYRPGLRMPVLGIPIFVFAAIFLKEWPLWSTAAIIITTLLVGLVCIRLFFPGRITLDDTHLTIPQTLYHFRPAQIPIKAIFYWEQMGSAEPYLAIHYETEHGDDKKQDIKSFFRSAVPFEDYEWLLEKLNDIVKDNGHAPAPEVPEQDLI